MDDFVFEYSTDFVFEYWTNTNPAVKLSTDFKIFKIFAKLPLLQIPPKPLHALYKIQQQPRHIHVRNLTIILANIISYYKQKHIYHARRHDRKVRKLYTRMDLDVDMAH